MPLFWTQKRKKSIRTLIPRSRSRLRVFVFSFIAVISGLIFGIIFVQTKLFAASTPYTWDFSNSGDYTLSDSTHAQISGNSAHLTVQNYSSDSDTAALYHLDENSGTSVTDSSANNNTGTATAPTWTTGNMNNALSLDGSSSRVVVPDSASLSITSSNTLEAWTKFNSSFSAGSHDQRQPIFDKGDYQLYYDNETGKIVYELADSTVVNWSQVAGNDINASWDLNGAPEIESAVALSGYIYVGTGNATNDAEVWKWDGTTWTEIGGDNLNSSWGINTFEAVYSLTTDGTNIYAGLGNTAGDAEVWKWNGSTWSKVGGDAINSSWAINTFEWVYSLNYYGGTLFAGLGATAGDAEVWSYNGSTWTKIGGDAINSSWANSTFETVYALTNDGTNLYAGLGLTAGDGEVWKWNGSAWSKIGGDGVNSSWNTVYETVLSMTYYGGNLYAGIGITADEAEVWRFNGTSWSQIGGDSLNSGWTTGYEGVYSMTNDDTNLYVGLGLTAGDNEVWRWNGTAWTKIGGDGINSGFTNTHTVVNALVMNGSTLFGGLNTTSATMSASAWTWNGTTWTQIGGDHINFSWGYRGLGSVFTMVVNAGYMYAGTGLATAGNAMVWRYDGSLWTLIGGQGVNGSWAPYTFENVLSMVSYHSNLYVGLGTSPNDAEVWKWDGASWTKVGGDSLNSGWTTNFEEVASLSSEGGYLYAGLGASTLDAEVWRYSDATNTWLRIGGDGINSSWNTSYERVFAMGAYNGDIYAGLGSSAGDAEIWKWNGSAWSKVGGDTINGSWDSTNYENVVSMINYNGLLIVGLGISADDAEVWSYNGSTWSKIGGDEVNSSWSAGTYEEVRTMSVYDGDLYAGLGNSAGDGEVWKYNGSSWSELGGDSLNSSWTNVVEEVQAFSPYKGKLYAGLGNTANTDAAVWVYGNNGYVTSATSSQDTNWHHIAATYDGAEMKIYIDGVEDASSSVSKTIPNTSRALLIGASYAGREQGKAPGYFEGLLDEMRISTIARSSFTTAPYSSSAITVSNTVGRWSTLDGGDLGSYVSFAASETAGTGTIRYRLSDDNGSTWKYYNGSSWVASSNTTSEVNTVAQVNTNIQTFLISDSGLRWQAILKGDGTGDVTLSSVTVTGTADTTNPDPPTSVSGLNQSGGGVSLTSDIWYAYATPYFSWSGAGDTGGAGVAGYYVYFGTDNTATPSTAGDYQTGSSYSASGLSNNTTYYLRVQTKDKAQNVSSVYSAFTYKFDASVPSAVSAVTVSPSGYASTDAFTFAWPSVTDSTGAGLAGYQYQIGETEDPDNWSTTVTDTTLSLTDVAYQVGTNNFYIRAIDNSGNASATTSKTFLYGGAGPSEPKFLSVTPETNTENSFAFTWQAPDTYSGTASDITYCYTVNVLPSSNSCSFTTAGFTSLSAAAYATAQGLNTLYVVAKNPESSGGAINYANYSSVTFTADTSAPGMPLNMDIADVSVKSTSSWKIALSWEAPTDVGSGVSSYEIWHSLDGATYSEIASTTGIAYVDTGLTQVTHYYKVRACDSVNNCGAYGTEVSLLPTGKYTEAAAISADPTVSNITTKRATISWSTDRASDSKIAYGVKSGDYFDEEPSNSSQVTDHEIKLTNLKPGTKYYYVAKWTDEDGNTGLSDEGNFSTSAAPTVKDPVVKASGISSVNLQFTVKNASKVKVYYGKTSAFGGIHNLSTSTAEATYTVTLSELEDGTKYFYKINTLDIEDDEYDGSILSFETLPRPKISEVRIQQVKGTAQPTVLVSWSSNTEISSIVTYYPLANIGEARDQVDVQLKVGPHRMLIKGLAPETVYGLVVKGIDKAGNEAVSDVQKITTATDTRPALISNLKVEGSVGATADKVSTARLVVSWDTDEPSTTQVEFGEGTGATYSQTTSEDSNLTYNHVVIIPELNTSKVYHLRANSKDKAGNLGKSIDTVTITPKASDSALNLVISNLQEAFGFLGGLKQK